MTALLERLKTALADRYRIERELGSGGMATVYLAHDLKHDRRVALKVMRPELSAVLGGERFLREVSIAAKLNHPHILALYDSGHAEEFLYYVMPYVEGESLRAKLSREKQLSLDEALSITKQVGSALDYAHEQGVIHRDIKPENILMYQGEALVADFGIALAVSAAGGTRLTDTGLSLGTPEYMSPEQATAERELDARSDLYSLGAVTYEMLVGEPPHTGNTIQAIIAKVVSAEPQPVSRVRHSVPINVDHAVQCALAKTPADRFSSGAEFAEALANPAFELRAGAGGRQGASASMSATFQAKWGAGLLVALVVGMALGYWLAPRRPVAHMGYDIGLPDSAPLTFAKGSPWGEGWTAFAVSPQEDFLVYIADRGSSTELWYRSLVDFEARPIPGTDGAYQLFLSPDGEWVAFLSGNQLKRSRLDRDGVAVVAELNRPFGGDWSLPDTVAITDVGLSLIDVQTGARNDVTLPEGCIQPSILPGERSVLCSNGNTNQVLTMDLEGRRHRMLGDDVRPFIATDVRVIDGRFVVYISQDGQLSAAAINLGGNVIDRPTGMQQSPRIEGVSGAGQFRVTQSGHLFFVPGVDTRLGRLVKAGGIGQPEVLPIPAARIHQFDISHDGNRMAVVQEGVGGRELWLYDLASGRSERWVTAWDIREPRWMHDGDRVVFNLRTSTNEPFVTLVGSPTSAAALDTLQPSFELSQVTSDGLLVGAVPTPNTELDVVIVSLAAASVRVDTLRRLGGQQRAAISPDHRWIAYLSTEADRDEVFLEPLPGRESRYRISVGLDPLWLDATTLVYRRGTAWYTVRIARSGPRPYEEPQLWFEDPLFVDTWMRSQVAHPDGSIIYVRGSGRSTASFIRVVPNWVQQMKRAVANAN